MTRHPCRRSSARRVSSRHWSAADEWCSWPSYSTASRYAFQPRSRYAWRSPGRGTRIWVAGRGRPPSTRMTRSQLSGGEPAPRSARASVSRTCHEGARRHSSSRSTPRRANWSRAATASRRGSQRAQSRAVRPGVVTRTPRCSVTSSGGSVATWVTQPGSVRWPGATSSTGQSASAAPGLSAFSPHTCAAV
nr:hypothetical protein [Nonomuraea montanisoli]